MRKRRGRRLQRNSLDYRSAASGASNRAGQYSLCRALHSTLGKNSGRPAWAPAGTTILFFAAEVGRNKAQPGEQRGRNSSEPRAACWQRAWALELIPAAEAVRERPT
jgi:hypothetical protein